MEPKAASTNLLRVNISNEGKVTEVTGNRGDFSRQGLQRFY